jgi:DNA-binding winged helix-turn-helix (wHTH) protein
MTNKQLQLLEEAREHFYAWRMLDAYNIFRRYFDRLPFFPEKEHAEFISPFVRVLFELGKEFELKFYVGELEKLYQKQKLPHIAYALGFIYSYSGVEKMEAARQVFDSIVRDPDASHYHARTKMLLADYYLRKGDVASCRGAIDSIGVVEEPSNAILVEIWKGVVARREGKLDLAKDILIAVILSLDARKNWYAYFSAMNILAMIHVDMNDLDRAEIAVKDLERDADLYEFFHRDKSIKLNPRNSQDRLLLTLLKKGFLEKALIVKGIYGREYLAEKDDKLIYYHVHCLRKRLRTLGLSMEILVSEREGYRWTTKVETTVEEL